MLTSGQTLGSYEILGVIGAGGMGQVYRARDKKLNREVAIKVLPDAVAADADRLARFTREAQTLAALNHPNIATIYGFEEAAGPAGLATSRVCALVMELVPGDDLSAIIARHAHSAPAAGGPGESAIGGPAPGGGGTPRGMSIEDAVPIARQIAEALETAHEQGIIHRDLKPANVKVRADGTVKVLDFGLAKALTPEGASATADAMNSPTLTNRATQLGMILGTAAYMAPEQAKGRAVDRRADIWALGVVLYEMLSGRRAFDGEDASTTMAAVLMKDPDWSALPQSTPAALRQLIRRCVERDPKLRLRDIGEARIILNSPEALRDQPVQTAPASQRASRPVVPWLFAGLGIGIAAVALALGPLGQASTLPQPVQFALVFPPNVRPLSNGSDYSGAVISPDGRLVAFSAADMKTGKVAIYLRRVDSLEATMIANTGGGKYPFWAPSSKTIAFYAQGKLSRVDIDGTSPMVICDAPTGGWGGSWNRDDIIVTGARDPGPIFRVSAKGGDTPKPVTTLPAGELDHDWPQFLPDGHHFMYTAWGSLTTGETTFYVGSIDSTDRKVIRRDSNQSHPMAFAEPGFALFIREGSLMAQRLDASSFELQGDPVAIAANAGGPIMSSSNGTLTYATTQTTVWNRMVLVNRDGAGERPLMEPGIYADPAISPDGSRIAFAKKESRSGSHDIYIRDIATGTDQRLTLDPADDRSPVWSPAGDEIIFSSQRNPIGLYRKKANGAGADTLVSDKDGGWAYQWHRNGFVTLYLDKGTSHDLWQLSLKDSKVTPLITSNEINELRGSVSPDGRWLVYDARETSRFEVFLTTYPQSGTKVPVTSEGGGEARWSADGKELFYVSAHTGALMVASVTPGNPPTFSAHRQVHPGPLDWGWTSRNSFDVDPKTGRILLEIVNAPVNPAVLLNWQGMIKK